jgi:hypothetical protein
MSNDGVHVTARVRDPNLVEALEEASDEAGSRSEAIRVALRDSYLDGRGDDGGSDDSIPAKARDAHRQLVDWTGIGGRLELDTAESVLANHLNIQKDAVRRMVIYPLKQANAVEIHQGIHTVSLVVGTLEGDDVDAAPTTEATSQETTTDDGETRERLDELAAAGAEVADGE